MSHISQPNRSGCPDCDRTSNLSRREFIKTSVGGVAALGAGALALTPAQRVLAAPTPTSAPETLVGSLYKTLTQEQKGAVCFEFDNPLRKKVDNNWFITKKAIKDFFTPDQQALIKDIFNGIHSPEYAAQVMKQVEHDNDEGFGACNVAMFGNPGEKFEFVLTGRHVTRRCDGNSVEGAAFGGPIFYGHAAESDREKPDHPGNVYWYQAKRANEVFAALSGKQRELSLRTDPRKEEATATVRLSGKKDLPGLPMTELSRDQKELVRKVMADVLAPFRKADVEEAMKLIEDQGGFDAIHLSFFKNLDVGDDGVWDVWQLESPNMLWYFRGHPHVHTWVHIRERGKEEA
jgi:hypothetical protein